MEFPNNFDIDMLRIALEQYFCNVSDFDDEELISYFQKAKEATDKDEYMPWGSIELGECPLFSMVWEPFEDVYPSILVDNIVELVKRLDGLNEK